MARPSIVVRAAVVVALALGLTACQGTEGGMEPAPAASSQTARPGSASPSARAAPGSPPAPVVDVPVNDARPRSSETAPRPVRVEIDHLDVEVDVEPVGVADDGQMAIPPDAYTAGWYAFGPVPGAASGTAVIAAHVDSIVTGGLGPFARLARLDRGDLVTTTDENGTMTTFEVVSVKKVAKPEIDWHDVFTRDGDPRLVLITCGGSWNSTARHYSDNVVVTAVPST